MYTLISIPLRFFGWCMALIGGFDLAFIKSDGTNGEALLLVGIGCIWVGRYFRDAGIARRIAREERRAERIDRMADDWR